MTLTLIGVGFVGFALLCIFALFGCAIFYKTRKS